MPASSVCARSLPCARSFTLSPPGSGPDFFIAVGPHAEWGNGHTVWGRVVGSMAAVDAIAALPVQEETWGQTHVTTLLDPLPFTISLKTSAS